MWRRFLAQAAMVMVIGSCGQPPPVATHSPAPAPATPNPSSSSPVRLSPSPTPSATIDTAASYARAEPAAAAPPGAAGAIHGGLSYPADFIEEQAVYAITLDGRFYYRTDTVGLQSTYTIVGVAAGDYLVFSLSRVPRSPYPGMPPTQFGAGYTTAIACGLSVACTDHTPIPVHVTSGKTTSGVNPVDWYGSFALVPGNPQFPPMARPSGFTSPEEAAATLFRATRVERLSQCDANSACYVLDSGVHAGQHAAYMTGTAGSNQDLLTCSVYIVQDAAGWQPMDLRCGTGGPQMPFLNGNAHVSLSKADSDKSCVSVHTSPGANTAAGACLALGAAVTIDGGPAFVQPNPPDGYWAADVWWHVAGLGWVIHTDIY